MSAHARFFAALAFAGVLVAGMGTTRADEDSDRFLWESANASMAAAQKPADFLKAARSYNRLVAAGVRNGPLFANLGTALLLASDGPNAIAALQRAERYSGSTPDIRTNLRLALALRAGQPDADLPWERVVFFWHFDQPVRTRTTLALACWSLFWLGILLRFLVQPQPEDVTSLAAHPSSRIRTLGGSCVLFGLMLTIIFGASATFSWLQERADERTWAERVFVSHEAQEAPR